MREKQALEEAKRKESEATTVSLPDLKKHDTVALPHLVPQARAQVANVNYSVPVRQMTHLKAAFGNLGMTYRDVGPEVL